MIEATLLLGLLASWAVLGILARRVSRLEAGIAELVAAKRQASPVAALPEREEAPPVSVPRVVADRPVAAAVPPRAPEIAIADLAPVENPESPPAFDAAALFERFVGGRLLVWTGGIAIALAGLFLVRYSIERGLISPAARMVGAGAFGLALLATGEWARRRVSDDPRIGQALVGAGVLILYAAAYGAHVLYGLIGLPTAFALMAAVAGVALALSLRHGAPAAALGLVGGYLTPLLVGDVEAGAAPLLGYLALIGVAVFAVALRTGRPWLAWAARWLTLGWTGWLLASVEGGRPIVGLFVLVFTLLSVHALRGREERYASLAPGLAPGLALIQLGSMVAANAGTAEWTLFLLFAGAGIAGAARYPALSATPGRAVVAAVLLLAGVTALATVGQGPAAVAATLLFAGGAWLRLRPDAASRWTRIFCLGVAGPALALRLCEAALLSRPGWAALFAGLSLAPAALAWRLRTGVRADAPFDGKLLLAAATAAGLLGVAAFDALPALWLPIGWLLVAGATLAAGRRLGDGGVLRLAAGVAGAGVLAGAARASALWEAVAASIAGEPTLVTALPSPSEALPLLGVPAVLLAALWRATPAREAGLARGFATAAGLAGLAAAYVFFKQGFALRSPADFVASGFAERVVLTQALFAGGWALLRWRGPAWTRSAGWGLTALAAARFGWFDLVVLNPAAARQVVGDTPFANLLLPAYGLSALWLWEARRRVMDPRVASLSFALFLAALIAGVGLQVRQMFAGAVLVGPAASRAEFYGYSLGGLLLAVALLVAGWRRGDKPLRVAGLALLSAAVVKVFLVDAAALEGILRILSFAGLGVALIGMGKLYGTLLGRKPQTV